MKLAVVGGGSTYTPELIDGFARLRDTLPIEELVLVDPAADRLELVGGLARRIFAKQGHPGRIVTTSDLDAGVADADAVLLQLRVGGQAARNQDETWPLECGCVGQETTGAAWASPRRCAPCRSSWTSPSGSAGPTRTPGSSTSPTRSASSPGRCSRLYHKAVGLCNVAIGFQRKFARLLDVTPAEVHLDHVGLNHLTWELGVRLGGPDGENVLPRLLAEHGDAIADDLRMPRAITDRLGVVPSYYLRYFYAHDAVVRELGTKPSRAAEVAAMEKELLAMYGDPALDEKPALLAKRGGAFYSEAAVDLASSLLGSGGSAVQVVNTYNKGTLPFLPDDAVIEVQARVDGTGATPLAVPALDPLYAGLISNVTAYEDLALEAALLGGRSTGRADGRNAVFKALLAHPLIGQFEYAEALTDKLIAHNREHLAWA